MDKSRRKSTPAIIRFTRLRLGTKSLALIVVGLSTATFGLWLQSQTSAAVTTVSIEAEGAAISGNAGKCNDSSASQGSMVKFSVSACRTFVNPVKRSTADPGVLLWQNQYYMVSTAGDPWFGISVSDDLVNWRSTGKNVFNGPGTHPWGKDRFWAPEIHRVGDRFAVYYTVRATAPVVS